MGVLDFFKKLVGDTEEEKKKKEGASKASNFFNNLQTENTWKPNTPYNFYTQDNTPLKTTTTSDKSTSDNKQTTTAAPNFYNDMKSGNAWKSNEQTQDSWTPTNPYNFYTQDTTPLKTTTTTQTKKKSVNPFLDANGNLYNENVNYQALLDSPKVDPTMKSYIQQATGLTPTFTSSQQSDSGSADFVNFATDVDADNLASLDVVTELPKLSAGQISKIISTHFSKSTVITPLDAEGIYKAQEESGMSALAILGIGALESGYGTSNIAKLKNNLWGWGATNDNPGTNAKSFSPISKGALEFANSFMKTYYNGYGAKSIHSAGTGDNPAKKGYAYHDNGSINPQWASSVGTIMKSFYETAKAAGTGNAIADKAQKYLGTPYVWGGESMDEGGMDCSGFVYNALKDAGYNVGRTTAQGYRGYGKSVSKSDMQAGDLIFFGKNNNDASHIGIYLGNGKMIHSSGGSSNTRSNPGKGVCVVDVNYRNDFLEARRY